MKIYKMRLRRGRSAAAHIADRAFSALVFGAVVWLTASARFANVTVVKLITIFCAIAFLTVAAAIDRMMLDRHITALRRTVSDELTELNMLKNYNEIKELLTEKDSVFSSEPDRVTCNDVLAAMNSSDYRIISFGKPTEKAKRLMTALDLVSVSPINILPKDILDQYRPEDHEIDKAIIRKYSRKKRSSPKKFIKELKLISRYRAFRYIGVGAALMLMSFFVGHSLWYRFIASISLGFGGTILAYDNIRQRAEAKEKPPWV